MLKHITIKEKKKIKRVAGFTILGLLCVMPFIAIAIHDGFCLAIIYFASVLIVIGLLFLAIWLLYSSK